MLQAYLSIDYIVMAAIPVLAFMLWRQGTPVLAIAALVVGSPLWFAWEYACPIAGNLPALLVTCVRGPSGNALNVRAAADDVAATLSLRSRLGSRRTTLSSWRALTPLAWQSSSSRFCRPRATNERSLLIPMRSTSERSSTKMALPRRVNLLLDVYTLPIGHTPDAAHHHLTLRSSASR
jgi:hypothetical protein